MTKIEMIMENEVIRINGYVRCPICGEEMDRNMFRESDEYAVYSCECGNFEGVMLDNGIERFI